jgi:hypothetical protein
MELVPYSQEERMEGIQVEPVRVTQGNLARPIKPVMLRAGLQARLKLLREASLLQHTSLKIVHSMREIKLTQYNVQKSKEQGDGAAAS